MLVQSISPTQEDLNAILSLDEAKTFMNILDYEHDAIIQDLIESSIAEGEGLTNLQFAKSTFELYLPNARYEIRLPKNPIIGIEKIEVLNDTATYDLVNEDDYYIFTKFGVSYLEFSELPQIEVSHKKALKITFTSGYGSNIPRDIKQWLKVKTSTLFEYRENIILTTATVTNHLDNVLNKYKVRAV